MALPVLEIKPTLYFDPTEPPAATAENRPKNTFDPPHQQANQTDEELTAACRRR
jgi:hypothetical protein